MPEVTTAKFYEIVKRMLELCKSSDMFQDPRLWEFKDEGVDYVTVSHKKNGIFSFHIVVRDSNEKRLLETFDATAHRRYSADSEKTREEVLKELNSIVLNIFKVPIL